RALLHLHSFPTRRSSDLPAPWPAFPPEPPSRRRGRQDPPPCRPARTRKSEPRPPAVPPPSIGFLNICTSASSSLSMGYRDLGNPDRKSTRLNSSHVSISY